MGRAVGLSGLRIGPWIPPHQPPEENALDHPGYIAKGRHVRDKFKMQDGVRQEDFRIESKGSEKDSFTSIRSHWVKNEYRELEVSDSDEDKNLQLLIEKERGQSLLRIINPSKSGSGCELQVELGLHAKPLSEFDEWLPDQIGSVLCISETIDNKVYSSLVVGDQEYFIQDKPGS
jgi:hypothetical protein